MKFSIEMSEERFAEMQKLMDDTGIETVADLITNSLTLLQFAVKEEQSGRSVASVDEEKKVYNYIRMPIFDALRDKDKKPKKKEDKKSHLTVIK